LIGWDFDMQPAGRIAPQGWMTAPDTRAVLAALQTDGQTVRFVGGCVRDALAGRPVKDVDIATPDPPETVLALLRRAGLKAVPTGLDHGTVTAVSDHHPFEITTLRTDVETYGRRARVAFTDDWAADAARRDFTMNAMFCAPDGTVYDPFGGWADLQEGRVRFVGDPDQRITEDYLRLLRFFRFHARYGVGRPDAAGLAAAERHAPDLVTLAAERIHHELLRFLEADAPGPAARIMAEHRILDTVLPEAARPDRLEALAGLEAAAAVAPDPFRRLAGWLDLARADPDTLFERLRLSKQERKRLATLHAPAAAVGIDRGAPGLRAALYRLGPEAVRDLLLLDGAERVAAGDSPDAVAAPLRAGLAEVAAWSPKRLPVDGRDVQALGVPPGPRTGDLLRAVEDWWIAQDFAPGRAACLEKLREVAGA
jgi:poly(A) polymerase